ncbi:MAG: MucR family transcriptional regulator [Rhodopila sp.]
MSEKESDKNVLALTAQIVSAHIANNDVGADRLASVIRDVYKTLAGVGEPGAAAPVERAAPAVPIKKSVFPDYIVCLEDGKQLKMLKRHLSTAFNLTPEQYRAKWGLDPGYPMVAPNYAEKRSSLAKQTGLGARRAAAE